MGYKIVEIEGIGPSFGAKLIDAGIATTDELLERGANRTGRKNVADATGISEKQILSWVNMADLFRVPGVGPQYAELLEKAGVDTVKELRNRNALNLAVKLAETQASTKVARTAPGEKRVLAWVTAAKTMQPTVQY
jgi:predicted RecB family nuclease